MTPAADLLAALPVAVYTTDVEGRITFYNEAAAALWGRRPTLGSDRWCGAWRLFRSDGRPMRHDECPLAVTLRDGRPVRGEEAVAERPDGSRVPFLPCPDLLRDSSGAVTGAVSVLVDATGRRPRETEAARQAAQQQEEMRRLLVDELDHRVKNTLAIIQAIASQSLQRATSPEEFATGFSGRVEALARAHDLLVQGRTAGTQLSELVRGQVAPGTPDDPRITCAGPPVMLGARLAVQLALVLHELATNAGKHGGLSVPAGRLAITWRLVPDGRVLVLEWRESGLRDLKAPASRGFGTTLIAQTLEANGGDAVLHYDPGGLVCALTLPLEGWRDTGGAGVQAGTGQDRGSMPALRGLRVLVVEDEPIIAMDLAMQLASFGCQVVGPAGSLPAAMRLIEGAGYDVALLDANLAGRPADTLAAALTRKGVPFAFATGYGREGLPPGYRDAAVLTKPFRARQLRAAIEDLLGR